MLNSVVTIRTRCREVLGIQAVGTIRPLLQGVAVTRFSHCQDSGSQETGCWPGRVPCPPFGNEGGTLILPWLHPLGASCCYQKVS